MSKELTFQQQSCKDSRSVRRKRFKRWRIV